MVWPNRGAFGAIGGYGLNVLKLLQGSHRCCRYAPAANPEESSQDNPASPSAIARILYRGPGQAPLPWSFAARPQPRARGTPGVQLAPRGLDAARHRGLSKSCVPRLSLGFERSAKRAASPPNL